MTQIHVTTTVNGDEVEFLADPRETLLDCLRDKLGMTGAWRQRSVFGRDRGCH